ncbi:MAG: asparagine--tRNA ligase [Bacteroidetes bacterium]|nr:asparagine--tRNA ligase [Bacteroidota bacterium]
MQIKDLAQNEGKVVTLNGWVANTRDSKGLVFIILRDGSGYCQCIADLNTIGEELFNKAKSLTQESSVSFTGKVVKDERQIGGYELHINDLKIFQLTHDYPITNKEHGVEFLMDNRHLWLRSKRQWAIMKIRNTIIYSIHNFFQQKGFVQMDAPLFTGNAAEGTTTLFETDFYGEPAYLSQSGQLYGEAMAMALGNIYTFGPTFRAEKSKTRRHLSEFWMIEPEMTFYDNDQNMDLIEEFLHFVVKQTLEKNQAEFEILGRDTTKLKDSLKPYIRVTYTDAVEILKSKKAVNGKTAKEVLENDLQNAKNRLSECQSQIKDYESQMSKPGLKKGQINYFTSKIAGLKTEIKELEEDLRNIPQWMESAANFEYGSDFGGSDETVLTRLFDVPVMVYNWPHEIKAFYFKRTEDNKFAKGVDVLAPEGYGEIVGGGERETNIELLMGKINEHKLPMEVFEWYLDLRRYGSVPHSGFGLGLERLVAWICKLDHVRETIPFPRMYGRLKP